MLKTTSPHGLRRGLYSFAASRRRPHASRLPSAITKLARTAYLMVPETGKVCQSRQIVQRLRKCTGQEDGSILGARATRTHQQNHILPALQRRLDLREIVGRVYLLLVDFEDYVAAMQAEIF